MMPDLPDFRLVTAVGGRRGQGTYLIGAKADVEQPWPIGAPGA